MQPFFPLSDWAYIGLSWGDPRIFWPQLGLLIAALVWAHRGGERSRAGPQV